MPSWSTRGGLLGAKCGERPTQPLPEASESVGQSGCIVCLGTHTTSPQPQQEVHISSACKLPPFSAPTPTPCLLFRNSNNLGVAAINTRQTVGKAT